MALCFEQTGADDAIQTKLPTIDSLPDSVLFNILKMASSGDDIDSTLDQVCVKWFDLIGREVTFCPPSGCLDENFKSINEIQNTRVYSCILDNIEAADVPIDIVFARFMKELDIRGKLCSTNFSKITTAIGETLDVLSLEQQTIYWLESEDMAHLNNLKTVSTLRITGNYQLLQRKNKIRDWVYMSQQVVNVLEEIGSKSLVSLILKSIYLRDCTEERRVASGIWECLNKYNKTIKHLLVDVIPILSRNANKDCKLTFPKLNSLDLKSLFYGAYGRRIFSFEVREKFLDLFEDQVSDNLENVFCDFTLVTSPIGVKQSEAYYNPVKLTCLELIISSKDEIDAGLFEDCHLLKIFSLTNKTSSETTGTEIPHLQNVKDLPRGLVFVRVHGLALTNQDASLLAIAFPALEYLNLFDIGDEIEGHGMTMQELVEIVRKKKIPTIELQDALNSNSCKQFHQQLEDQIVQNDEYAEAKQFCTNECQILKLQDGQYVIQKEAFGYPDYACEYLFPMTRKLFPTKTKDRQEQGSSKTDSSIQENVAALLMSDVEMQDCSQEQPDQDSPMSVSESDSDNSL